MKTKIVKTRGYYSLIVDDDEINKKYKCESKPIVLGSITEFADAGQWRVEDYRLRKHLLPSAYLEEGVQQYQPVNDEQKAFLETNLYSFEIDKNDGNYSWCQFDSTLYEGGDLPCLTDKNLTQYSPVARFTFKKAYKLLREQQSFWNSYDSGDLKYDNIRMDNPHRQMGESEVYFNFSSANIKLKEDQKKANKP